MQSTRDEVAVGAAVAYKTAGAFVALTGACTISARARPGSTTNVITRTAVSFVAGTCLHGHARGDAVTAVTANKPALDNTANR